MTNTALTTYLKGWDFSRVLRLILGVFIIGQGVQSNDWSFILLGSLFTLMPILNIGCCGTNGCSTSTLKSKENKEEVTYEEVK
jgi:hypothetical protein